MKLSSAFIVPLLMLAAPLWAQETPATPAPSPTATPDATPAATPTPEPSPTPKPLSTAEVLNSLSTADLQEAVRVLKASYIHPEKLSDEELSRALLEGLLLRLRGGALLTAAPEPAQQNTPHNFLAEILDEQIGYLRIGQISPETVSQLDTALENFGSKSLTSVVLDLREASSGGDLEQTVEIIKRFVPKGRLLFTMRRPAEKQERIFTSNQDPKFSGLIMILVDGDTAGLPEILAASVRSQTRSMILGSRSAGRAVQYEDRKLPGGAILRVAVSEVVIPGMTSIFPGGVTPDLEIPLAPEVKKFIFKTSAEKGVSQFVFDKERPRMNEAALVAGTSPEIDAYRDERTNGSKSAPKDSVLQRAVDLITSISIYERKPR